MGLNSWYHEGFLLLYERIEALRDQRDGAGEQAEDVTG